MSSVRTPVRFLIAAADATNSCLHGRSYGRSKVPASAVLEVVGREDRVVADLAQARAAVRADVGVGAHEHAGVADEAAQPPDRGRPLPGPLEAERAVVLAQHARRGQVRQQRSPTPTGPAPGPPPPCGVRERLVDVEVHDVEAGLAGLEPAEDGVEVGPVHVGQGARRVDGVEELADAGLEEPERRGVGDHHRGRLRPERGPERVEVDAAVGSRRDRDRPEAGHRGGRRVRAVRWSGTSTSSRSVSPRSRW